jgi:hypothetical protein
VIAARGVGGHGAGAGRGERSRRRLVEHPEVDPAARRVLPAQVPGRDHQRRLAGQHGPQVVRLAAQVGERLRVGGVRPEHAGEVLAGLRQARVRGEERDQATERDDRVRTAPDPSSVTACSPRSDTRNTPLSLPTSTLAPAAAPRADLARSRTSAAQPGR